MRRMLLLCVVFNLFPLTAKAQRDPPLCESHLASSLLIKKEKGDHPYLDWSGTLTLTRVEISQHKDTNTTTTGERIILDERIEKLDAERTRLTVMFPSKDQYNLVCGMFDFGRPPNAHDLRISREEMAAVLRVLAESRYYDWKPMTATGFPRSQTVLLLYGPSYNKFQCSLGRNAESAKSLEHLISPLTGDAQQFLKKAVASLMNETVQSNAKAEEAKQPFQDVKKLDLSGFLGISVGDIAGKQLKDIVTEETTVRVIVLANHTSAPNEVHLVRVARLIESNPTLETIWTKDKTTGRRKCDTSLDNLSPFFAVLLEGKNGRLTGLLFFLRDKEKKVKEEMVKVVSEAGVGVIKLSAEKRHHR